MEPDSCLLIAVSDSPANHKATLFMREKDSHSELWDGPRTGVKHSVDFFGVDHALPVGDLEQFLQGFAKANYKLWYYLLGIIVFEIILCVVGMTASR